MEINYSDQQVIKGRKSIFLAGPTPRNDSVVSWRKEFCKKLEEKGYDGLVYIPEYSTQKPKTDYDDQVNWELEALAGATIIVFWIPRKLPEMPAFTTNVEFGYWLSSGKVLYGRPDDAQKIKYLDSLYMREYEKEAINNIDDLVKFSIIEANKKYNETKKLKK